jgi:hypothetical protein
MWSVRDLNQASMKSISLGLQNFFRKQEGYSPYLLNILKEKKQKIWFYIAASRHKERNEENKEDYNRGSSIRIMEQVPF